ncbi:MAG: permease prefix domain 2-containing transporter [Allosphingosinicella sp.]
MFPFGSPEQFDLLWRNAKAKIAREIAARALPLLEAVPEPTRPTPPRAGEMLVGLLCKRDIREAVLGDLDEKFAELAERRGAGVAKAWYWSQAARSVLFFAVRWGRRLLALEAILKRIL